MINNAYKESKMEENKIIFEHLVTYIHSAIESEQPKPKEFSEETEKRLLLVYRQLRHALKISDPVDIS